MAKETMHNFLRDIELTKYENLLTGQGYTEEQDIFTLTEADLDSVQITEPTDRNTILNAGTGITSMCFISCSICFISYMSKYVSILMFHKLRHENVWSKIVQAE